MQKKLKRGLADLSNFFSSSGLAANPAPVGKQHVSIPVKPKARLFSIEPPEIEAELLHSKPSLITASILSFSSSFKFPNLIEVTEAVQPNFASVRFVSLTEQEESFESHNRSFHYEKMSWHELESMVQPQLQTHYLAPEFSSDKSLLLFDSGFCGFEHDGLAMQRSLFEFLDHCVFVVEPDTVQLTQVYQAMKTALAKNPDLRFSLFLVGDGAERFSEFIYERFSEIISNFLGRDLGFLGWMENSDICINPDLLKEECDNSFVRYSKLHFSEIFRPQQLVSH